MTYRDILVEIGVDDRAEDRARVAAVLAVRWKALVTGVFLKSDFIRNYIAAEALAYMAPDDIDKLLKDHAAAVDKASETARLTFENAAALAGAESGWRPIDGDSIDALVACARRHDLTIMAHMAATHMGQRRISAAGLGLASGGPVLVSPASGAGPDIGKRVLIAWKDSREAARALRDAWPFITGADEVHVLTVSPGGEGGPDGLLQRHFERHGVKANLIVDPSHDASAAEVLRREVKSLGVDLVVMGLYGRPRFSELVLGGVSQDLLHAPPVAMLVSH